MTNVYEDISRVTCQQFAIRNTFSSRCIRHTSFSYLIHHGAATALGSASPRRRKCSLLHVKVRSGCQHDTTNVGFREPCRANVTTTTATWARVSWCQKIDNRECDNPPSAREENICETANPVLDDVRRRVPSHHVNRVVAARRNMWTRRSLNDKLYHVNSKRVALTSKGILNQFLYRPIADRNEAFFFFYCIEKLYVYREKTVLLKNIKM